MSEIEVPSFFLCPISLEIMKDPVTLSTGITYDRESIEKWIFSTKNDTCPVTKQVVSNSDLTPNHTLRRLIQSWCTLNASRGVQRIPTPRAPITKAQIAKLLNDSRSAHLQIESLRRLRSIVSENETNKRCIEAAGAAGFLATLVDNATNSAAFEDISQDGIEVKTASDEALSILYHLHLSETGLKTLIGENGEFIERLMSVMQGGNYESRTYVVLLLKSLLDVAEPIQIISLRREFFNEIVQVLNDHQVSSKASRAALKILTAVCPWGRNRIKAVEAGAVSLLVNILLDSIEKRGFEMVMIVLDQLCQCAEGRAELLSHGAGLAVVSKKILRVSQLASERGVRILLSIAKFSAGTPRVLQEMLQLGVVAKLCLVLQVDCGTKTKEKAREILKLHARAWRNSPCLPSNLLSSYP